MELQDLPYSCETEDLVQTMAVASEFAGLVASGEIVLLQGPMGAGKTQFARGFCQGLGYAELWEVGSPTYTVLNHYPISSGVDHLDLYRLHSEDDLEEIAFAELLASPSIKLIEWPERLFNYPLQPHWLVSLSVRSDQGRFLRISRLEVQSH